MEFYFPKRTDSFFTSSATNFFFPQFLKDGVVTVQQVRCQTYRLDNLGILCRTSRLIDRLWSAPSFLFSW